MSITVASSAISAADCCSAAISHTFLGACAESASPDQEETDILILRIQERYASPRCECFVPQITVLRERVFHG